ncbi:MAG: nitrogenase iron-molybdenum protein subunit alpha [Oscillospiraceae bacterium]|jgi:nitrogenase molybdenum-iron protein alpha chain|nr:nitrogenase iron-molybdenum protein subunit alpha [Oscillospiraceae bacterium]
MSYYDKPEQPVRDSRLVIGDSYTGTACGALDCAKSGCMLQQGRRFWQANSCQMALSLMMAATIENAVIVMHSPIGCGSSLFGLTPGVTKGNVKRGKAPKQPIWLSTNLTEIDVISGGEKKLRETILYADREFRPEIILVIATCAPSIIGDDVNDVVKSVGGQTGAIVTAIHCPGFKSRVVASAYDAFYHSLISRVPLEPIDYRDYNPPERADPDYATKIRALAAQKQNTVNIFNATSIGLADEQELTRLLNAIGLNVRIFAEYCSVDELRMMSFAGLNVSLCNVHDDYILKYLQEKFDIPYIICGMPIGFASTKAWLLEIAEFYGLADRARNLIASEETQVSEAIAPFLPKLAGKRVLICGGVVRTSVEAVFLKEIGLDVIAVRAYHYDDGADPVISDLADSLDDTPFAVSNQPFEMVNQLKKLQPDITISHAGTHGFLAKAGFVSVQLWDTDKPFFGYSGIFQLVRRLVFAQRNDSYTKRLAANVAQPYRDNWFERDAYSYITD